VLWIFYACFIYFFHHVSHITQLSWEPMDWKGIPRNGLGQLAFLFYFGVLLVSRLLWYSVTQYLMTEFVVPVAVLLSSSYLPCSLFMSWFPPPPLVLFGDVLGGGRRNSETRPPLTVSLGSRWRLCVKRYHLSLSSTLVELGFGFLRFCGGIAKIVAQRLKATMATTS